MSEKLKEIIKESSPFGKFTTSSSIFKAWATSMIFSLSACGFSKEETYELLADTKLGFDKTYLKNLCEIIYSEVKSQDVGQSVDFFQPLEQEVTQ